MANGDMTRKELRKDLDNALVGLARYEKRIAELEARDQKHIADRIQVEWNVNDYVRFRLTRRGKEIWVKYLQSLRDMTGRPDTHLDSTNMNEEIRMQGHEMLLMFGEHCFLGPITPFKDCLLTFERALPVEQASTRESAKEE